MTKELNGRELAGFIKERQANVVKELRAQNIVPKLVIIRDSDNPVIKKYVDLKRRYGADIGVEVEDWLVSEDPDDILSMVKKANRDSSVDAMIVQLPLVNKDSTDEILAQISPEKDVDGLSSNGKFDSATATAINWLLAGNNVVLKGKKIAIVGRGRLVGRPLIKMWKASNMDVTVFHSGDDLDNLVEFDVVVTATGVPHLIKSEMIKSSAVIVDAGTASEDGVLVGDVDDALRARDDLSAITPRVGGVGPLTVSVLFENVIRASQE